MKRLRSSSSSDSSDNESESCEGEPFFFRFLCDWIYSHLPLFRSVNFLLLLQQEWQ